MTRMVDAATVDVSLPPGWFPLAPLPGILLTAVAAGKDGRAVATMVIRMQHCAGLVDDDDAQSVFAAVPADVPGAATEAAATARELRLCGQESVAVLVARACPGQPISDDDLAAALRQTVVYAVDSTGSAIRSSSADEANDACRGSTRTV